MRFNNSACYRKQDVFIYWFISECSGTFLDKCLASWVTACAGLVTDVEVSHSFTYSCRCTCCILISSLSSNTLKLCWLHQLVHVTTRFTCPAQTRGSGLDSTHESRRYLPTVLGKRNGGLAACTSTYVMWATRQQSMRHADLMLF